MKERRLHDRLEFQAAVWEVFSTFISSWCQLRHFVICCDTS